MAELAAIFESRVYARTVQQATSWMGEGLPEQFDKQVEQTVRIHTDVQLEGARIGRVEPDDAAAGFRALAVLDRRQAVSRWQRELAETQMAIDGQVEALIGVKGRLSRLAALNRVFGDHLADTSRRRGPLAARPAVLLRERALCARQGAHPRRPQRL